MSQCLHEPLSSGHGFGLPDHWKKGGCLPLEELPRRERVRVDSCVALRFQMGRKLDALSLHEQETDAQRRIEMHA